MKFIQIVSVMSILAAMMTAQEKAVSYNGVSWSPNSKYLAFTRMEITQGPPMKVEADVYTVGADGLGLVRVTKGGQNEYNAVFSRDGKTLYFGSVSEAGDGGDVYSIGIDGNGLNRVTTNLPHGSAPEFSHDGKWIVFNATLTTDKSDHKPQIYLMKSDGTGVKALTSDGTLAFYNPVWSPDGKRIVYYVERGDQKDQIWSMNPDGTDQKLLTANIAHNFFPSWTADGKRIIFTSNRNSKMEFFSMNVDGSDVKALGIEGSFIRQSPDGKKMAYTNGKWPNISIYVSNADGSNAVKLLN